MRYEQRLSRIQEQRTSKIGLDATSQRVLTDAAVRLLTGAGTGAKRGVVADVKTADTDDNPERRGARKKPPCPLRFFGMFPRNFWDDNEQRVMPTVTLVCFDDGVSVFI